MNFIASYGSLLQTRYGPGLSITQAIEPAYLERSPPSLNLQLSVDKAIKHNVMSAEKPLEISSQTTPEENALV